MPGAHPEPISAQLKLVLSKLRVTGPDVSLDPLSICCGVILAAPLESKFTVMFCVIIVGGVLSTTVTVLVT